MNISQVAIKRATKGRKEVKEFESKLELQILKVIEFLVMMKFRVWQYVW